MALKPLDENINLSFLDTRILIALAKAPLGVYKLARICEEDFGQVDRISNGGLYPALSRLAQGDFIRKEESHFEITNRGLFVLNLQLDRLSELVGRGKLRLSRN